MNNSEMLERLGSEATEELVHQSFDGMSVDEIYKEIHQMFPEEDRESNMELAEKVYEFCNK